MRIFASLTALALLVATLSGCPTSAPSCPPDGIGFNESSGLYCAYGVVVGGFRECPAGLPNRFDFAGGSFVCSDRPVASRDAIPDRVCRALPACSSVDDAGVGDVGDARNDNTDGLCTEGWCGSDAFCRGLGGLCGFVRGTDPECPPGYGFASTRSVLPGGSDRRQCPNGGLAGLCCFPLRPCGSGQCVEGAICALRGNESDFDCLGDRLPSESTFDCLVEWSCVGAACEVQPSCIRQVCGSAPSPTYNAATRTLDCNQRRDCASWGGTCEASPAGVVSCPAGTGAVSNSASRPFGCGVAQACCVPTRDCGGIACPIESLCIERAPGVAGGTPSYTCEARPLECIGASDCALGACSGVNDACSRAACRPTGGSITEGGARVLCQGA